MTESLEYSPVALFAYARVNHMAATVDYLLENDACKKKELCV